MFKANEFIRKYHVDGTQAAADEYFVFGSNTPAGRHGAGAAKAAVLHYGAIYGQAEGLQGRSYGLPTVDSDANGHLKTMSIGDIAKHVATFIAFANANLDKKFFLTRMGCVLAGYSDAEIAPMFRGAPIENCNFPQDWAEYLEEDPPLAKRSPSNKKG